MISMAADSDGLYGMVSNPGDDQPIDLSRGTKKSTRLMPPLIPISMLPSGYHQRRFSNREPLGAKRNAEPSDRLAPTVEESTSDMPTARDDDWRESQSSPKRTRLSGEDGWGGTLRLDRARSVPQLAPIPSLQRYKSLSESRIPEAAAEAEAKASLGPDTSSEIVRALELKHRLNLLGHNIDLTEILIYLSNYRQMYQNCQARELLRRLALQHQQDNQQANTSTRTTPNKRKSTKPQKVRFQETEMRKTEVTPPPCTVTRPGNPSPEDASEIRRRQARPLTGKHVRPGTGAKPSTLLTLRRKIQSRQPQLDQEPQLPKK